MADTKIKDLGLVSIVVPTDEVLINVAASSADAKLTFERMLGLLPSVPGGRLTLETGVPISATDQVAKGTLYYTPYLHNLCRIWDGTRWNFETFAEMSLALTVTAGKNYDVFLVGFSSLELSAAWTTDTARADALGTQNAIIVKSADHTRLWLGTIRASGSNLCEDSITKRFVWNAYNPVRRGLQRTESTDSWSYLTQTWRSANGSSANRVEYVSGVASTEIFATVVVTMAVSNNGSFNGAVGIGIDSTTAPTGTSQGGYFNGTPSVIVAPVSGTYRGMPGLGYHAVNWIEYGADGTRCDFYGDNGGTSIQSGLIAEING
jgi:hypothetical protein